jgi:hypothetical protein
MDVATIERVLRFENNLLSYEQALELVNDLAYAGNLWVLLHGHGETACAAMMANAAERKDN